jgi:peptide deformylase
MPKALTIVTLPEPSLRERSVDVAPETIGTPDFQEFIDQLTAAMFHYDGVGIAAPQVGRNIRVFIVNEKGGPKVYINPEIIEMSEKIIDSEEGCLSVPGVWGIVPRAKRIKLRALDRHGRKMEVDAKNFSGIILQHEFDHLEGILFIDKATRIDKGASILATKFFRDA